MPSASVGVNGPALEEGGLSIRQFFEEEAGALDPVPAIAVAARERVAEIELVHGSGGGDIEEAALFFDALLIALPSRRGEAAIPQGGDEDMGPLQAFGLVDRGQDQVILGGPSLDHIFAGQVVDQGQLAEEGLEAFKLGGVAGELLEVGEAQVGIGEGGLEVVFVVAIEDGADL